MDQTSKPLATTSTHSHGKLDRAARQGRRTRLAGLLAALAAIAGGPAIAQIPDQFTNLQVLPKDTSKRELVGRMRAYATSLGVRCKHCHVGESMDSLEGYDFASDAKPEKKVARAMMRMVDAINRDYLSQIGRTPTVTVECATCHHGLTEPRQLPDVLATAYDDGGVDAAIARYRALRAEHGDDGAYDFSARTLSEMAERLARQRDDLDGAIAFARLNVELHPDAPWVDFGLGELLQRKGDRDGARAAYQRALTRDPDNRRLKRRLAELAEAAADAAPASRPTGAPAQGEKR